MILHTYLGIICFLMVCSESERRLTDALDIRIQCIVCNVGPFSIQDTTQSQDTVNPVAL